VSPFKDDRIKASTARISGQEERMELMEDMITALAYTLKVPHPFIPFPRRELATDTIHRT